MHFLRMPGVQRALFRWAQRMPLVDGVVADYWEVAFEMQGLPVKRTRLWQPVLRQARWEVHWLQVPFLLQHCHLRMLQWNTLLQWLSFQGNTIGNLVPQRFKRHKVQWKKWGVPARYRRPRWPCDGMEKPLLCPWLRPLPFGETQSNYWRLDLSSAGQAKGLLG